MDNPLVQLDPGLFVWTIITFLILLTLLSKFAWKPLLNALTTEGDELIAQARSEAQAIVGEGKKAADQLKESTLLKAKEEAVTNLEQAKEQIQVEKDKAIAEIKGEVVGLSLSIAEKLVKKNLNEEDNKSLINESLKHIKGYEA